MTSIIAQAEAYVTSRFFPPLPREYGALLVEAVELAQADRWDDRIAVGHLNPVPKGTADDGTVDVRTLIGVLRVGHMIDDEED